MRSAKIRHDCKTELRTHALKATPARLAVLQFLEKTNRPLDITAFIDYLDRQGIKADPVTVFRIMNLFTDKGLTKRIQLQEGKFRYELSAIKDHHHLVCEKCGRIEDIEDNVIPALEKQIEEKYNFTVKRHSLEFFGLCEKCRKS